MKIIRFYLGALTNEGWVNNSYRDFDDLLKCWLNDYLPKQYSGLFHIGTEKPIYDSIVLNNLYSGKLLITASAKWAIRNLCRTSNNPILHSNEMPIYLALDGWGYDYDDFYEEQDRLNLNTYHNQVSELNDGVNQENKKYNISVNELNLPVRAINCLKSANIESLKDLYTFNQDDLKKIPNLGNKTINDINFVLEEYGYPRLTTKGFSHKQTFTLDEISENESQNFDSYSSYAKCINFSQLLNMICENLDERSSLVIRKRMGIGSERSFTLSEIGKELNVSRERIRQIEAKALTRIRKDSFWNNTFLKKLAAIIDVREDPMPLAGLSVYDDWFYGVEVSAESFEYILNNLLDENQFSILDINDICYISRLKETEWQQAIEQAKYIFETSVGLFNRHELRKKISDLLIKNGSELVNQLFLIAGEQALFSDGTEYAMLTGYGRSAESICEAILNNSPNPLHYTEVKREIQKQFNKDIDVRRVHAALGNTAHLFGRGIYGLSKHCLLNNDEKALIIQEVTDVMSNGKTGRQWSLVELLDVLFMNDFGIVDFESKIDVYVLDYVLKACDNLVSLGRHTYQFNQLGNTYVKRIDLKEAVISILEQAGKPLSYEEIKKKIQSQRGLAVNFQIHPKGSLISLASGVWGLEERDLPLTNEQQYELCDVIQKLLERTQRGIHVSEIQELINLAYPPAKKITEASCIFSIALKVRNETFSKSHEDYLYIRAWGDQRRLSKLDAVKSVISDLPHNGKSMYEIVNDLSIKVGRRFTTMDISRLLNLEGARYDEFTKKWYRISEVD